MLTKIFGHSWRSPCRGGGEYRHDEAHPWRSPRHRGHVPPPRTTMTRATLEGPRVIGGGGNEGTTMTKATLESPRVYLLVVHRVTCLFNVTYIFHMGLNVHWRHENKEGDLPYFFLNPLSFSSILLTEITTVQNEITQTEDALSYHIVRGLYFLAVVSAATIILLYAVIYDPKLYFLPYKTL